MSEFLLLQFFDLHTCRSPLSPFHEADELRQRNINTAIELCIQYGMIYKTLHHLREFLMRWNLSCLF
jgi:hypothetical protein